MLQTTDRRQSVPKARPIVQSTKKGIFWGEYKKRGRPIVFGGENRNSALQAVRNAYKADLHAWLTQSLSI